MLIESNSLINPLPNDENLFEAESEWCVKLPESYRSFLKKFNGCIPSVMLSRLKPLASKINLVHSNRLV